MKNFDINVWNDSMGNFRADVFPMEQRGDGWTTVTDQSVLASMSLTPEEAAALGFPWDEWYDTLSPLPQTLEDMFAVTLDELRAAE